MLLHLLAVGDVVAQGGLDCLHRHLRRLKKEHDVHFTVVNGENAAGLGLLPQHAEELFDAGADVITLGNHTWGKRQIADYLEDNPYILRPANFAPNLPGRGFGLYEGPQGLRLGVLNLMGRFQLDANLDSPFRRADEILAGEGAQADLLYGLVSGWPGSGGVGHPHPCPHRRRADPAPGHRVYHRPGDDRPCPVHSGGKTRKLRGPLPGPAAPAV